MKVSLCAIIGALSLASAAPAFTAYSVHERRDRGNAAWISKDYQPDRRTIIPLSIGLVQSNLGKGYDFLMDVSDPSSRNYGKHWTQEQVAKAFAPSSKTVDSIKAWLSDSGISDERVSISTGSTWVRINATIEEVESLLKTEYKVFEHSESGEKTLACDHYSVPESIKQHIDTITPTIHFALKVKGRQVGAQRLAPQGQARIKPLELALPVVPAAEAAAKFNYSICATIVYPQCLRALYNIPVGTMDKSSFGVTEYAPNYYNQTDLDLFWAFATGGAIPKGTGPKIELIDGAVIDQNSWPIDDYVEGNLDLEVANSLVYPQKVTLYQVGDNYQGGSFGNFLDAIDGSYCTYDGGDDPNADAIYPDPNPLGWQKKPNCGTVKPASVISTSYMYNEPDLSPAYQKRQCYEYMKLGLQGISMLFASGDMEVASWTNQCCASPGCVGGLYNGANLPGAFVPSFPSTCPYVTSVGRTNYCSRGRSEDLFYSGGGFSNVFPLPSYQSSAMKYYYSHNSPDYTSQQYNNSQKVRGYPDISASGANFPCSIKGEFWYCYGTSISTPTFASLITLINEERIKAGKGPVGFLNPTLYANPGALNDIKVGGNKGCGTRGFRAVTGWDPVTGLGTPDYKKLLKVFMALP